MFEYKFEFRIEQLFSRNTTDNARKFYLPCQLLFSFFFNRKRYFRWSETVILFWQVIYVGQVNDERINLSQNVVENASWKLNIIRGYFKCNNKFDKVNISILYISKYITKCNLKPKIQMEFNSVTVTITTRLFLSEIDAGVLPKTHYTSSELSDAKSVLK